MSGLHTVAVLLPLMGVGFWLQLRSWDAPRVYFGGRPTLADCVLRHPERVHVEVRRD